MRHFVEWIEQFLEKKKISIFGEMECGKMLLTSEIKKVLEVREENRSVAVVARAIGSRRKVVMNFIAGPQNYGERKSPGRPRRKAKN